MSKRKLTIKQMQKKLKEWGKESRKSGDFVETVEQVFLDPALAKNS